MELIRRLSGLRSRHRPCVATIGAFDGVHLGHQAVLAQMKAMAARLELPSTLITFEPLPREYLFPQDMPARLTPLREKFVALRNCGVDRLLCLRFDEQLRETSARDFAEDVFVRGLGIRSLILGDDFRFGRAREGDLPMMKTLGEQFGFEVQSTETIVSGSGRISSTRIREHLTAGEFEKAGDLLGRPFSLSGRVCHGRALGRQLGAPTANIALRRLVSPIKGVFAVQVYGAGLDGAAGVANIGSRPTVSAGSNYNVEVHLLDREQDLYGQRLEVVPRKMLRPEKRFESLDALREQIGIDAENARRFFAAVEEVREGP